ncbi:MAG: hypothetical protein MJE68_31565, partial [Proteobacteria bacterium]|nr:hypothetical protein [Pseudomonadota bacterium]
MLTHIYYAQNYYAGIIYLATPTPDKTDSSSDDSPSIAMICFLLERYVASAIGTHTPIVFIFSIRN